MKTKLYSTLAGKKLAVAFFTAFLFFISTTTHAQTYTIFDPTTEFPSGGAAGAEANVVDAPVELGIKFRVTQGGTASAIRFYKGNTNTGTHIGTIWDNTGAVVASVTFTGETASGWQQMNFVSPVVLSPGITYTASYWGANGLYAASSGGLGNVTDITRGPFIIIAHNTGTSAADPGNEGNGMYDYDPAGGVNYPQTISGDASNYWVDISFTTFFPLPVSLVDFHANAGTHDIALTWKTESEHNNRGFVIQRSNNGRDWYDVDFINGSGESAISRNYTYTDKALAPGLYYYQLKQEDFDGKSKTSSVVTASINGKGTISLFPGYPNPVHSVGKIRFDLPNAQKVRLSIFDMSGKEVKVLVDSKQDAGSHINPLDVTGLGRQMYFVRLQTETQVLTQKIVVE